MRLLLSILFLAATMAATIAQPKPYWEPVGWGGGGLYWSAAFHPTRKGWIYMGGDVLGVYRSEDHGKTWKHKNNGIAGYEVLSLAVDPSNPDRIYAATSTGLSVSDDAGDHWRTIGKDAGLRVAKGRSILAIAVDPIKPYRIAFGTEDGRILESNDGGEHWMQHHATGGSPVSSIAFNRERRIVAATGNGLVLITQSGEAKALLKGDGCSIVFPGKSIGYAAMGSTGLFKSTNGGSAWTKITAPFEKGERAYDVVADRNDPNRIWCLADSGWSGAVLSSTDGGQNWTRARSVKGDAAWNPTDTAKVSAGPMDLSSPKNLAINPNDRNELFIAANWRSVYSNDGGQTWEERTRGADITVVTDIRFHGGRTYVTAMDEGLFVSDDSPLGWKQLFPLKWDKEESGHHWRVHVWDSGKQILSTSSPWDTPVNQVFRSLDAGKSFLRVRDGLPATLPKQNTMWERGYPRALAVDPKNPATVYLGIDGDDGGGLFKSADAGWHWTRLAGQPGSKRMFYGLAVDPTDSNRLFWAACGVGGGLYRSEDGGTSWQKTFDKEDWLFNVHIAPDGTVYAPGKELWASRDHGSTWTQLTSQKIDLHIVGLEVDPINTNRIWFSRVGWSAAPQAGIYESTDGGKTWAEITGDIPNRKPLVLRYDPAKKELWAGGTGLFKLPRP